MRTTPEMEVNHEICSTAFGAAAWSIMGRGTELCGSNGNYSLTDNNGNTFQLAGDTAKLSQHVGHEVKITGTTSSPSASEGSGSGSGGMGQANDSSQQAIQVKSVQHISKICKSGGASQ